MTATAKETPSEMPNLPPQVMRRRASFLSGRPLASLTPFIPRKRDLKPHSKFVQKPEGAPSHGGFKPRKKKLTGSIPLAIRKKMLAAKLRKAGVRTVAGYFAKKAARVQRAAETVAA